MTIKKGMVSGGGTQIAPQSLVLDKRRQKWTLARAFAVRKSARSNSVIGGAFEQKSTKKGIRIGIFARFVVFGLLARPYIFSCDG